MRLQRWQITGWIALTLGALIVGSIAAFGFTEEATRTVVRGTARISVVLFLLAFAASSVRALWPSDGTRWLLQNRRYIGVSFATSHLTHLAALVALGIGFPDPFLTELQTVTIVGGGLAYLFIVAMMITSFTGPRRAIGERAWKVLHTTGSYYIWLIFLNSYLGRALQDLTYAPFAAALLLALGLRIMHWVKRRSAVPTAKSPA